MFLIFAGFKFTYAWLQLPIILFIQLLLVLAMSFLVAAFIPLLPDLNLPGALRIQCLLRSICLVILRMRNSQEWCTQWALLSLASPVTEGYLGRLVIRCVL